MATIAAGVVLATPAFAGDFFFTTGNADGLLGALSRSDSPGKVETETADDFFVTQTTIINGATIVGLVDAPVAIRNARLAPDWVRIGTDVGGATPPTFNMTFSLAGDTVPGAGIPGDPTCHGDSISAHARQFGGIRNAASTLGYSSVAALQGSFKEFCNS